MHGYYRNRANGTDRNRANGTENLVGRAGVCPRDLVKFAEPTAQGVLDPLTISVFVCFNPISLMSGAALGGRLEKV